MKDKRPIDRKRESGGVADIGTEEDGAIVGTAKIGERLIIIKERSLYEFLIADNIDPKRTNIGLPNNIQKLIIDKGTESEMVSRTFLTAKNLLKPEYLNENIDSAKALTLILEILPELDILEKEVTDYLETEQQVSEHYETNRDKPASYTVPSIGNVETRCKTIFQKADHIEQMLIEMIVLFYQNEGLKKQSHFPNLQGILLERYGKDDPFYKFVENTSGFMALVRNLRNALDHRLDFVKVTDFELQSNSDIISPTIELTKYRDTKLERQSLSEFLPIVLENIIFIIENTLAYICNNNARTHIFTYSVREIPDSQRRNKYVKYSFWSPLGEGGFYHQ
jgi:hypothetical protein